MKVRGFHIKKFARPELTSAGPIEIEGVPGNDILIQGENQSGKTHTFNALLYSLLGETIALQRGHGNAVELDLSDGFEIFRGEPGKTVQYEGQEFGPKQADQVIQDNIGPREILRTHFLHSRISELPLEELPQSKRHSRVLDAIGDDLSGRIKELEQQVEELQDEKERKEAEQKATKRERRRRKRQLSQIKSQFEKWSTVEKLAETGQLEEISEALQRDPELEKRINGLTSEKRSLITDIRGKKNERTRAEELEEEVREIIIKSLEEFICPVCEERVNRSEASSRLDDQRCPFCDQSTDIRETYEHLEKEIEKSEGQLDEIERELEKLKERKDEVDSKIQSLKDERPVISELNSYAVSQLKNHEHDIEAVHEKAIKKRKETEEELDNYSAKVEEVESQIEELAEKIDELAEKKRVRNERVQKLEEEDVSTRISNFEEEWNHHYQRLSPQIAENIHFQEEGEIILLNDDGRRREYDRRGDLADAEVVLLNISFVIALNQVAVERGGLAGRP